MKKRDIANISVRMDESEHRVRDNLDGADLREGSRTT